MKLEWVTDGVVIENSESNLEVSASEWAKENAGVMIYELTLVARGEMGYW